MDIDSLNKKYAYNDWLKYFQKLLPDANLTLSSRVQVETPTYFENLGKLLQKTDRMTYINYGFWRITADAIDFLPSTVQGRHQEYIRQTTGIENSEPRSVKCIDKTIQYFPVAVEALYARQKFMEDGKSEKIKEQISEITENLKVAIKEMIQQVDWMDDATKAFSDERIDNLTVLVGFPDNFLEDHVITKHYKAIRPVDINITEDNFYETTRKLNIAYRTHTKLKKSANRQDLINPVEHMPSFKVKYSPNDNTIRVPIVLLNHFFNEDRPNTNNYGEIGFVIARKMIRAISDQSEWSSNTTSNFEEKAKCVVELYGNFTDNRNASIRTLEENIIDNGSLLRYQWMIAIN